jgi:hypothetical protein
MDGEDLRLAVYGAFAGTGRVPSAGELAARLGVEASEVTAGLAELARGRHLALGDRDEIAMDLGTLWRLAAHWYDGRLERGYVRREPSQAAAYLRGVGLAGTFWGL